MSIYHEATITKKTFDMYMDKALDFDCIEGSFKGLYVRSAERGELLISEVKINRTLNKDVVVVVVKYGSEPWEYWTFDSHEYLSRWYLLRYL